MADLDLTGRDSVSNQDDDVAKSERSLSTPKDERESQDDVERNEFPPTTDPREPRRRRPRRPGMIDYLFYSEAQRAANRAAEREPCGPPAGSTSPSGHDEKQNPPKKTVRARYVDLRQQLFQSAPPSTTWDLSRADLSGADQAPRAREQMQGWNDLRLTPWLGISMLCTADIFAPFAAPGSFRAVGYVPGTLEYLAVAAAAVYCSSLLWWLYGRVDSRRFPAKNYGDLMGRYCGEPTRLVVTGMSFLHMLLNVAVISWQMAQTLYQITNGGICFLVAILVFVIAAGLLTQIRTLNRYSPFAGLSVLINIVVVILSAAYLTRAGAPNTSASSHDTIPTPAPAGPVDFAANTLRTAPFLTRVTGAVEIAHAFGGATLYPHFLGEMRTRRHFPQALLLAHAVSLAVYLGYGLGVYARQGQYTPLLVAWHALAAGTPGRVAAAALRLVAGTLAAGLYGNIGLKLAYANVVERALGGPPLLAKRGHAGRIRWTLAAVAFAIASWLVAAAVPQVVAVSTMVSAVTNLQFTYACPPGLVAFYLIWRDASGGELDVWQPGENEGRLRKVDSWWQWSRWRRGLFGVKGERQAVVQVFKWFNFVLCLAATGLTLLGVYSSAENIAAAVGRSAATSFTCVAPPQ